MVIVGSLDRVAIGKLDAKSIAKSRNNTTDFSSTLNKAQQASKNETNKSTSSKSGVTTAQKQKNEVQTPVTNTESQKNKVEEIKEDVVNEQTSSPLTLEFLLPTQKVDEQVTKAEEVDFSFLLQATSVQQIIEMMGGQPLVEGEQLNLDQVAKALGMQTQDLQSLIAKLTNTNQQTQLSGTNDLWTELGKVDQKVMAALQQIAAAINGHGDAKLTKKEAQQAVALFKLIDLAAPKTDLTLKQESQAAQMKNWLSNLAGQISEKTAEKETMLPFAKATIRFSAPKAVEVPTNQVTTAATLQSTKPSVVTIQLPSNGTSQAQSAKFVEEFQNVLNRAQFASNAAGTRLLIKLYPEHLGTIRIELVQKDGMLSAKLLASNTAGKQMIDSTLHQLKQGFVNQNIQLDRLDVAQALTEPNKSDRGNQFGQQSPQSQQTEQDEINEGKQDELKSFEEILAEMEE